MTSWGVTLEQVTAHWSSSVETTVLEQVTLQLEISKAAVMFPLMGPSGEGKSTLLYLLAALKWPSQGQIIWSFPNGQTLAWGANGQPNLKYTIDKVLLRRHYFGFAFQSSTLSPYMRVIENITYPLLLQGKKENEALKLAETTLYDILLPNEKADKKKQAAFLQKFPHQLSGGQRQRVALAQAIVHDPYVLFADEPTGQLDLHTRQQVMTVLKRWVEKDQGQRALIWVTHHHIDDLDLMEIDHLLFVENKTCLPQTRIDLKRWMANKSKEN